MRTSERVVANLSNHGGRFKQCAKIACLLAISVVALDSSAQTRKDFKYQLPPGATLIIENQSGPIVVKTATSRQVSVTATLHSANVEIDPTQSANRVELRTHQLQPHLGPDQVRVDYEVTVPPDVAVTLRSANGPISVQNSQADVTIEGDTASVDVHDGGNGHVHVRTLSGPIRLTNITNGHVEITSVSGAVDLNHVSGPHIELNTTNGKITFNGDCAGDGVYAFSNHNADIDVTLPASASVDILARSVKGSVQNDFPFQAKQHTTFASAEQRSYAGTSNSGGSSLQLRSFSGTIRVKKQ